MSVAAGRHRDPSTGVHNDDNDSKETTHTNLIQHNCLMNEFDEMIAQSKPTLVDFFATWCGPCRMQGPILEQVKSEVGDSANVIKVDIDRNAELSARYNIRSVPTLIVFKDGEAVWRGYGLHQKEPLVAKVKEFVNDKKSDI